MIGLALPAFVHANAVAPEAEYGKKIKAAGEIAALGDGMFGNQTSESNGNTIFQNVDVSLPGNDALPVQFGRRLLLSTWTGYINEELGGIGNWDADVPYIEGTFSQEHGWAVAESGSPNRYKRCSAGGGAFYTGNALFSSDEVGHGYTIHVPGVLDSPMMVNANNHQNPTDGVQYPWVTSSMAKLSCHSSMKNGYPGEGFVLKLTNGTKYYFDYAVERSAPVLRKAPKNVADYSLQRKRIFLLATLIEDRFGNFVTYEYDGSLPVRIASSDGRVITAERVGTGSILVRANGRTWTYVLQGGHLRSVQLPDASKWEYDPAGTYDARVEYVSEGYGLSYFSPEEFCAEKTFGLLDSNDRIDPNGGAFNVKHPSGAEAAFEFVHMVFGRSRVPYDCRIDFFDHFAPKSATESGGGGGSSHGSARTRASISSQDWHTILRGHLSMVVSFSSDMELFFEGGGGDAIAGRAHIVAPNEFESWSLRKLSVTGAGLAPQVTSFRYLSQMFPYCDRFSSVTNEISGVRCNEDPCASGDCQDGIGRWVETTLPSGDKIRKRFGVVYGINEGLLLEEQVVSAQGQLMRHVLHQHLDGADTSSQPFSRRLGFALSPDPIQGVLMPLKSTEIRESGESFISEVSSYDTFGRPLRVLKTNSMGYLNHKYDAVEYHDNYNLWVIGQTRKQYTLESGPNGRDYSGGALTSSEVEYNNQALPWKIYKFGRLDATLTYHADGTVATVADGKGNITTLGNWKRGIPRHVRHPATPEAQAGATEMATVDDNGWITSVTDEVDAVTGYGYDAMGRLASIVQPTGDTVAAPATPAGGYYNTTRVFRALTDADWKPPGILTGQWLLYEQTGNHASVAYMDALWRPVLTHEYDTQNIDPTMRAAKTRYDSLGRVSFASYPSSALIPGDTGTRTSYDALGRVTRVEQDAEGGSVLATTTEYLPYLRTRVTNPRGAVTTNHFMAWDQPTYDFPILSQQPEGKVVSIDRHPQFGWPLALTQRNSAGTLQAGRRYVYDGKAQLCKTIEPETGVTVMGYDAAGNPAWQAAGLDRSSVAYNSLTDCQHVAAVGAGRTVARTYDPRNRLTHLNFPGGGQGNQIWTYKKDNLPESVTTYNDVNNATPVVTTYTYNNRRLLVGETLAQPGWYSWSFGYAHDGYGHLSTQTYPTGLVVDYAPNPLGQPTKAGTYAAGAQYYPNGALKQFTYGNGIVHTMMQNARQLPQRVTATGNAMDYEYGYDPNGNVAHVLDHVTGTPTARHRWMTYDSLDRLTSVASAVFGGSDHTHRFTYDALDNLTSWKHAGVKDYAEYIYDANNRLTSIRNTAGATVVGLDYDPQGNLHNRNGLGYEFDFGNRLRTVAGKEGYYRYDGLGRRVLAHDLALGLNVMSQYSQSGQLVYQRDAKLGKALVYVALAGSTVAILEQPLAGGAYTPKYQHTDALGSPVAVTNASGQVIERMDYEPWGAIIGKPNHNGIGYTGHVMDAATGLTYMQQRYYDQSIGRFLSVDPVTANPGTGANFNRYWYANNNPYKFIDPDGRQSAADRFGDQFKRDAEAGNSKVYEPFHKPAAVVTGLMLVGPPVVLWAIANPYTAVVVGQGTADIAIGDALGGASVVGGLYLADEVLDTVVVTARKLYGPFNRQESPTQTAETARLMVESGELWGTGMRQVGGGRSPNPVAQAYDGPLPEGVRGVEFYTPVAPSTGSQPGSVNWYRGTNGVRDVDEDYVSIPIEITKNTQE